jgi:hypothetical protein
MGLSALTRSIALIVALPLATGTGMAADNKDFEYPELLVSPSASDRLANEAKNENKDRWSIHWAIQASALTTLMAGLQSNGDPGKNADEAARKGEEVGSKTAAKTATYVGGLWLVATTAMSASYTPYQSGVNGLKGMPQANKKDRLAYERYAEESIYGASRVATVMKWTAFATNAGASMMVVQNAYKPMTRGMGALAVVGSTLPLLFEHRWNSVQRFQGEYKKRIYGPLSQVQFSLMPKGDAMAAVTQMSWNF